VNYLIIFFVSISFLFSQLVQVGAGSYTTSFPGTDEAGRNSYPSGQPQTIGPASSKHIPTNDWWSSVIKNDHVDNLFNYPMALKTVNTGLVVSYIPWGVYDDQEPIIVGLSGLSSSKAKVYDFSDWTVTLDWTDGNNSLQATSGVGMPFIYFSKDTNSEVEIEVNLGQVTVTNEKIIIENARNGADFVIYAPTGSSWEQLGNKYTSNLNGQDYWSLVMLPQNYSNLNSIIGDLQKYAYVFPQNTSVQWSFDDNNSFLYTDFLIDVDVKEGIYDNILQGILPHQWNNLSDESAYPNEYSYNSVRGELKMLNGNNFSTKILFSGILPTLPALPHYSEGYNPADLQNKISQIQNNQLATWTDSYNEGQVMNRLVQTARIAHEVGNTEARDQIIQTVKNRLEDWLTASSSEVAFIFYYNSTWSTLIGYPSGHGQDNNINDHHFHWGYFIHAASFIEQFEPGWANEWGEMVNHLVRDAASANRDDPDYPFLRSFSPFAGHCWANGFATFPQGNDQESTSESMQFNSSLIHWGSVTGNDEIRDLGIYLYSTERTAIDEYWFDMYNRNFSENQQYSLVSRVWGNSYDNGTFWTNDIAASYGIEMYPIHGGSFYLSHNLDYTTNLWLEITSNTGILNNEINPNLWHDVFWKYLAYIDPASAIELYNSNPDRILKFGISDAQTYYWLHSMNALGKYRSEITANWPIAASFNNNGQVTYVAHNYTEETLLVSFSDGYQLTVEAGEMSTNRGEAILGSIQTDFNQSYLNGSALISFDSQNQDITRVEFYDNGNLIGEAISQPFEFTVQNLSLGTHDIYAKMFSGSEFGLTNFVTIVVGEQLAYNNSQNNIPGIIEPGKYDIFEGGLGQNISYFDNSLNNEGTYRIDEYVDVEYIGNTEGPTLGWIEPGEWVEYSINVLSAGYYDLEYRYASDIAGGGGPFYLEINEQQVSDNIYAGNTGDWYNWQPGNAQNVELNRGQHILRIVFIEGGFNLGRLNFTFNRNLDYNPPLSNAGEDLIVILPNSTTTLNGSLSSDTDTDNLNFQWTQIYGPNTVYVSSPQTVETGITGLMKGTYKFNLIVDDNTHSSEDDVYVFVSDSEYLPPTVSLNTSNLSDTYYQGTSIELVASATDIDGNIELIQFFDNNTIIAEITEGPFQFYWDDISLGSHIIKVIATDNDGLSSESNSFGIEIIEAPSCIGGPSNGDYTYEFSDDLNNPTLTFIPSQSHVGNPTCILYYSISGTPPGYNVSPDSPFQINANEGEMIQFYYTYSYNGLERNTSANPHTYEVGSCFNGQLKTKDNLTPHEFSLKQNYPNPFNPVTKIQYELPIETIVNANIYNLKGEIVKSLLSTVQPAGYKEIIWRGESNSGSIVPAGIYILSLQTEKNYSSKKMILLK